MNYSMATKNKLLYQVSNKTPKNLNVDGKFILLLIIYLSLLTDKKNKQKKIRLTTT